MPAIAFGANSVPFVVAALSVGVLQGILDGAVPASFSTWSIGMPIFARSLEAIDMPDRLVEALRQMDELSALQQLVPEEFEAEVIRLKQTFEEVLSHSTAIWEVHIVAQ